MGRAMAGAEMTRAAYPRTVALRWLAAALLLAPGGARAGDLSARQFNSALIQVTADTAAGAVSGSGFLVRAGERLCVVTNVHVLCAARSVSLRNADNDTFRVVALELSPTQDLARLVVEVKPRDGGTVEPLVLGEGVPALDDKVTVYGDSLGTGNMTRLKGKILGLGADRLEVSSGIVPGNSGGPIVAADGTVIGVAAHVQKGQSDWLTTGTRFAEARRFGERLTPETPFVAADIALFRRQGELLAEWPRLRERVAADYEASVKRTKSRAEQRLDKSATPLEQARAWRDHVAAVRESVNEVLARVSGYGLELEETRWLCGYLEGQAADTGKLVEAAVRDLRKLRTDAGQLLKQANADCERWCVVCGGLGGRMGMNGRVNSRCMGCRGTGRKAEP